MAATFATIACSGLPLRVFGLDDVTSSSGSGSSGRETAPFVIFVAHGREGTAADVDAYCAALQRGVPGCVVVSFDQRNHGHRLVEPQHNGGWPENPSHPTDMYAIQWGTACDIIQLADMLPAKLGFTPRGLGVTGFSLGGHTALLVLANDERFSVGVSIVGCGDFEALMRHRAEANQVQVGSPEYNARMTPQLLAVLRRRDPIHRASVFKDRALLMLAGQKDKLVPALVNAQFLPAVRQHSNQISEVVVKSIGHRLAPEFIEASVAFFAARAQEQPPIVAKH